MKNASQQPTAAQRLAKYAHELDFRDLPAEVTGRAKRILLDTIGCAFGGYGSEASRILQEVVKDLDGPKESTVVGSGYKTSCLNAILVNGAMVRYLDYDAYRMVVVQGWPTGGHACEVIPGALAVAERQHSSGKDLIAAIVLGFEVYGRLADGELSAMEKKGWTPETKGTLVMPLVAGKLLGLTEGQLANAVGISGSHNAVMGVLDVHGEDLTMTKNLKFPRTAYGGTLAAFMARRSFTGPLRVLEGNKGFAQVVMGGEFDVDRVFAEPQKYRTLETSVKAFCADGTNQGHLSATYALVRQHDIKPEDVARVNLKASTRCVEHCADAVKRDPKNKETADHSSFYTTAALITDRALGPGQYTPEKLHDPRIRELMDKVSIVADPEIDRIVVGGFSEIITKEGATYRQGVEYPRGNWRNPMTDQELEAKFSALASEHLDSRRMKELMDTIYHLEQMEDVKRLASLLVFPAKS